MPTSHPTPALAAAHSAALRAAAERRGLAWGLLGVALFALTLPMTRLAVGPQDAPQLPPLFVTAGRAAVAGLLSLALLALLRVPRPSPHLWPVLGVSALGTVLGFPLFLALALRQVPAMHAAVVTGVLPLATAVLAAWAFGQRPSRGFWVCAVLGCALVIGFAAYAGGGRLHAADGLLLGAVFSAAVGYVAGARAAAQMPAWRVICWVLVMSLPFTLPVALAAMPTQPGAVLPSAWLGFGYVSLVSMWLGFFAWYHALAVGGAVRVSQVQLLQPFLALLFAAPVAGEALQPATLVFSLVVMATVFAGTRMSVQRSK